MKSTFKYWVRTAAGLEKIFLQEFEEIFHLKDHSIKHKSVFFDPEENIDDENQLCTDLRTADDIYKFIGYCTGVDNTKLSTEKIIHYFEQSVLPAIKKISKAQYTRITVSFLGT